MNDNPTEFGQGLPSAEPGFYAKYKGTIWAILISAAVIVAVLIVYLVFFRGLNGTPDLSGDVAVEITAPDEVPSGSELAYDVSIKNLSNTKLTELNLEVFYPRGFTFLDSSPDTQDGNNRNFMLQDLSPGQEVKISIIGSLEGSVQEIKGLNVKLHYVPENFRSSFVSEAEATTVILAPNIDFKLTAPVHVVSGETVVYSVALMNISDSVVSDLFVHINFPNKFEPTEDQTDYEVGALAVGEQKQLNISGRLLEEAGREALAVAELRSRSNGEDSLLARSFAFTQLQGAPLQLTLTRSDSSTGSTIQVDKTYKFKLNYRNDGPVGLRNVQLSVGFDEIPLSAVQVNPISGLNSSGSLLWSPAGVADLLVINPGVGGSVDFELTIPPSAITAIGQDPQLVMVPSFVSETKTEPISGPALSYKVRSRTYITAQANRISGPDNPSPETPSTYRITFQLSNSVSDVENVVLTAHISRPDTTVNLSSISPPDESGNLTFSSVTGFVNWKVGTLPAFTGFGTGPRTVTFELVSGSQNLLQNIEISGTNTFTGEQVDFEKISSLSGF